MQKPINWAEFEQLASDPARLSQMMRIRLIELLFTSDNATAIRAAEMLQTTSVQDQDDVLSDVPLDILLEVRDRARRFIISQANG